MIAHRHRRSPSALGRTFAVGALVLSAAAACAACASRALVALPSIGSDWVDAFTAKASSTDGVTVEARTRGWPGPSLELGERATPMFVRVENGGQRPLELSRASFELVTGTAHFRAIPPEQIGAARADLRRKELATGVLDPGESRSGFVYFEPVIGDWGFVHLRASLVDASTDALVRDARRPLQLGAPGELHARLRQSPAGAVGRGHPLPRLPASAPLSVRLALLAAGRAAPAALTSPIDRSR